MQHFDWRNLDQIKDAKPKTWATVHSDDAATFSELVRRGFHLIDISGELWTLLRVGDAGVLGPVRAASAASRDPAFVQEFRNQLPRLSIGPSDLKSVLRTFVRCELAKIGV